MLTLQIRQFTHVLHDERSSRPIEIAVAIACLLGTQRPTSRAATTPEGDPCELVLTADTHGEAIELLAAIAAIDAGLEAWAEKAIEVREMRQAA